MMLFLPWYWCKAVQGGHVFCSPVFTPPPPRASVQVYPPINVLPSLSRLMKSAIGEGMTRK